MILVFENRQPLRVDFVSFQIGIVFVNSWRVTMFAKYEIFTKNALILSSFDGLFVVATWTLRLRINQKLGFVIFHLLFQIRYYIFIKSDSTNWATIAVFMFWVLLLAPINQTLSMKIAAAIFLAKSYAVIFLEFFVANRTNDVYS